MWHEMLSGLSLLTSSRRGIFVHIRSQGSSSSWTRKGTAQDVNQEVIIITLSSNYIQGTYGRFSWNEVDLVGGLPVFNEEGPPVYSRGGALKIGGPRTKSGGFTRRRPCRGEYLPRII